MFSRSGLYNSIWYFGVPRSHPESLKSLKQQAERIATNIHVCCLIISCPRKAATLFWSWWPWMSRTDSQRRRRSSTHGLLLDTKRPPPSKRAHNGLEFRTSWRTKIFTNVCFQVILMASSGVVCSRVFQNTRRFYIDWFWDRLTLSSSRSPNSHLLLELQGFQRISLAPLLDQLWGGVETVKN